MPTIKSNGTKISVKCHRDEEVALEKAIGIAKVLGVNLSDPNQQSVCARAVSSLNDLSKLLATLKPQPSKQLELPVK